MMNIRQHIFGSIQQPILAPLMADATTRQLTTAALCGHAAAVAVGIPGWECPLLATTGIPCPGCGLSRGIRAFLSAEWAEMAAYHLYAPIFTIGICLLIVSTFLPDRQRRRLVADIRTMETRTGLTAVILISFVFYWGWRLAVLKSNYIVLMAGG